MNDLSLHLAPNAPWLLLAALTAVAVGVGWWAYRFSIPPLPALARRTLPALRIAALALLLWLLAQPVLERAAGGGTPHLVALVDRSASMELPARRGGPARAEVATRAIEDLRRAWRGRAVVDTLPFAAALGGDTTGVGGRDATALGDALASLGASPAGQQAAAVVVVSDGVVNAGSDPEAAARSLGIPVHALVVGEPWGGDRRIGDIEASPTARVGQATPVKVHVESSEPRGTPIRVRLADGDRVLGERVVRAPGGGAEAVATFDVTPAAAGLALWTASVDSMPGDRARANDARSVAVEVAPGRLGVTVVSAGLNWDLAFLRRALAADSTLEVTTWVRERGGWRTLERRGSRGAPDAAAVRGQAVVVLDGISPAAVSPGFDRALAAFVRSGGGLLLFGGPAPGLVRYRDGALGPDLAVRVAPGSAPLGVRPAPRPEARELLAWDEDAARGDQAWREAAPLSGVLAIEPGAGDRVLVGGASGGPPLLLARRVGRGQALMVNGTGVWRWTLAAGDDQSGERGRTLWRRLTRWLAEPAQAEPLRVRPERWLAAGGEPVRLFATLQDDAFRPLAGAAVSGEVRQASGRSRPVAFQPRAAGTYVATLPDLPPGRYRVSVRATRNGRELGRATSSFAVDRWSLEVARSRPDSAALARVAAAAGGRVGSAERAAAWSRAIGARALVRPRAESVRLWESPWMFALVVGLLAVEWGWRRRRGLP